MAMDPKVEAALKGIGAEIPFVRGYIDSLESDEQNRFVKVLEQSKITSLNALVTAVDRLNPNLGRGLEIREAWMIRRPYQYEEKKRAASFRMRNTSTKATGASTQLKGTGKSGSMLLQSTSCSITMTGPRPSLI